MPDLIAQILVYAGLAGLGVAAWLGNRKGGEEDG